MKKFYIIVSVALLLMSYILIPADAPVETVRKWLATEVFALALLYFVFHTVGWEKSNR
jgi:hypothetical protein